MLKKISFNEIANLVTKGDNKIDEKDAQKARSLGLAFVIAGMNEKEFDKAANKNPQAVEAYMSQNGILATTERYLNAVGNKTKEMVNNGITWLKEQFFSSDESAFDKNGKVNIKNLKIAVEKIVNSYPDDLEKQDQAIKKLLGEHFKQTSNIRGAERGYELKDGSIIIDSRGSVFGAPNVGSIILITPNGKENEIYRK